MHKYVEVYGGELRSSNYTNVPKPFADSLRDFIAKFDGALRLR